MILVVGLPSDGFPGVRGRGIAYGLAEAKLLLYVNYGAAFILGLI